MVRHPPLLLFSLDKGYYFSKINRATSGGHMHKLENIAYSIIAVFLFIMCVVGAIILMVCFMWLLAFITS